MSACSSSDPAEPAAVQADAAAEPSPEDAAAEAQAEDAAAEAQPDDAAAEAQPADSAAEASAPDGAECKLVKPYSSSDTDCNDCAELHCCAEVNTCYESPDCDDTYVNCMLACLLEETDAGPEPCLQQCGLDSPKGKAEYEAVSNCADTQCKTECE
jgi:hypothetical protein